MATPTTRLASQQSRLVNSILRATVWTVNNSHYRTSFRPIELCIHDKSLAVWGRAYLLGVRGLVTALSKGVGEPVRKAVTSPRTPRRYALPGLALLFEQFFSFRLLKHQCLWRGCS